MKGRDIVRYPEYWSRVACRDWYETENKMWMCLSDKNAICEIDKERKEVHILGNYPQNGIAESNLSATVIGISEKIVFLPLAADDIAIYDIANDELTFIPVKKNYEKHHEIYQERMKFRRGFVYKDYVFLLGHSYPAIIQLNINTLEVNYLTEWVDIIEPYIEEGDSLGYFKEGYSLYGTQMYLPLGCCSGLMLFELEQMKFEYIAIQGGTNRFEGLTDINGMFYMTGRNGRESEIIIWNKYTESIRKIRIPIGYYYAPIVYNSKIFLFSFSGSSVIELETNPNSFKEHKLPESFFQENSAPDIRILAIKPYEKILKILAGWCRIWYEFDWKTNGIVESIYRIEDKQFLSQSWAEYCDGQFKEMLKGKVILETVPIKEYLMWVDTIKNCDYLQKAKLDTNGKVIWDYLKML